MLRTLLALLLLAAARPACADMTGLIEGTLGDTGYLIGKPDKWNGGLILFAHGYEGEREGRGSLGESDLTAHFKRGNYAWAAAGFRSAGYRPDWFLADTLPVAAEEEPPAPFGAPVAIAPLEPAPAPRPAPAAIVTEIASHPRFAESGGAVIDERAIGALWSLGDGSEFFDGVIEAFRTDARSAIGELNAAAAAADPHRFEEGVQALRRCTANFGSGRLRELLLSLGNLAPAELQRQGSAYVQRLEAEIGKLEATLVDYAKAPR